MGKRTRKEAKAFPPLKDNVKTRLYFFTALIYAKRWEDQTKQAYVSELRKRKKEKGVEKKE